MLYDSRETPNSSPPGPREAFQDRTVEFGGHFWILCFSQSASGSIWADYDGVWLVLVGGTIINLLLFGLLRSLFSTRANARRIASELTRDLRQSEQRLTYALEAAGDGI